MPFSRADPAYMGETNVGTLTELVELETWVLSFCFETV